VLDLYRVAGGGPKQPRGERGDGKVVGREPVHGSVQPKDLRQHTELERRHRGCHHSNHIAQHPHTMAGSS